MSEALANPSRRQFFRSLSAPQPQRFERVTEVADEMSGVLWAAHASSPENVIVAGDDGAIFCFDGDEWRRERIGTDLPIHALASIDDDTIIAVGWLGLICERLSGEWSYVQGGENTRDSIDPTKIRENRPLFDVATTANGEAWAVGDAGRVVHRDGDGWHEVETGVDANLRCVLPLSNGSVLVGGAGGVVLRFDGERWTKIETNTASQILGMAALSDDDIIAVGGEYVGSVAGFVGRIFRSDGKTWEPIDTDRSLPRLRRVRVEGSNGLLLVGDGGVALRYENQRLTALDTRLRFDLQDAVGFADGTPIICGDGGVILTATDKKPAARDDEQSTTTLTTPVWNIAAESGTAHILRGLWAASDECVFAVGDAGTARLYQDGVWSDIPVPSGHRLHAVWGTSPTNVYACGDLSTIFHYDGKQWTKVYSGGMDVALLAITGFGPHEIFVVGDHGTALRFDGQEWHRLETGTRYELYDVWGQDGDHVLAVGGGGVIARWNGKQWATFSAGTDEDLFGVWGSSLESIHIAGLSGTVIKFGGQYFDKQFSGLRNDLHAVDGKRGGPVFAVGSNGVVLRYNGTSWDIDPTETDVTLRAVAIAENYAFAVGSGGSLYRRSLNT